MEVRSTWPAAADLNKRPMWATSASTSTPYTGFGKDMTTRRVEGNGLFHVRQAQGARRIAFHLMAATEASVRDPATARNWTLEKQGTVYRIVDANGTVAGDWTAEGFYGLSLVQVEAALDC